MLIRAVVHCGSSDFFPSIAVGGVSFLVQTKLSDRFSTANGDGRQKTVSVGLPSTVNQCQPAMCCQPSIDSPDIIDLNKVHPNYSN